MSEVIPTHQCSAVGVSVMHQTPTETVHKIHLGNILSPDHQLVTKWQKTVIKDAFSCFYLRKDQFPCRHHRLSTPEILRCFTDSSFEQIWTCMPTLQPTTTNEWLCRRVTNSLSSFSSFLSPQLTDASWSRRDLKSSNIKFTTFCFTPPPNMMTSWWRLTATDF